MTTATGGAKRKTKKAPARKPAAKKPAAKKSAAAKGPTLEQLKKMAKRKGITLSKDGKAKTKAQLKSALARKK